MDPPFEFPSPFRLPPSMPLEHLNWWKEHLNGLSALLLPTDYPRSNQHKYVQQDEVLEPEAAVCKRLLRLALDTDTTPFTVILAIFAVLLHKWTGEEDVVVGSSGSNFNAQTLRLGITPGMTFMDVIAAVRAEEELAEQHDIPFAELMAAIRPRRNEDTLEGRYTEVGPLCQVRFFNMVDVRQETLEAVGECDWSVFVEQKQDARRMLPLKIRVAYNAMLFSAPRMRELLNQIQFVTQEVVEEPTRTVQEISLLTEQSRNIIPNPTTPPAARLAWFDC